MNIITIVPIDRERKILPINQVPVTLYNKFLYLSKRNVTVVPKGLLKEEDERGSKVVLPRTDSTDMPVEEVGDILSKVDYFSDDVYVIADSLLFDRFSRISNVIVVIKHDIICNDPSPKSLEIDKDRFEDLIKEYPGIKKDYEYYRRVKYSQLEYDLITALLGKNIPVKRLLNNDKTTRLKLCRVICGDNSEKDFIVGHAGDIALDEILSNRKMTMTTDPSMVTKRTDLVPSFGYKDVVLNKEDYVDLDRQDAEVQGDTLFIKYNHSIPLKYNSECGGSVWKISHLIDFLCKRNREKVYKV